MRAMFSRSLSSSTPKTTGDSKSDKEFVACYSHDHTILSPAQITNGTKNRKLGNTSKTLKITDFELLKTLGTGTFARVSLARLANPAESERDKVFALKVLRKADVIKLKQVEHVKNERKILHDVAGHPFITTMITSFQDHDSLYMLQEYCPGGEVFSYLRRARRFNVGTTKFYAAEIVLIFEFLHETEGVAYRDLKPENLLIDAEGHIKLVDFGFAKKIGGDETYTLCGTPEYLAPEVIQSKGHTTAVDWWALGIFIYEMLVGQPPFWDQNPMRIYEKIVQESVRFPRGMPEAAEDLINGLCTYDLTHRLGNMAGGASRVKEHEFFRGVDWDALYYRKIRGPIIPVVKHATDCSNFDEYEPEAGNRRVYTQEMQDMYESSFADF